MPLLWPSTRSARSAVAVVKSTVWPASTTARPRAIARCVLPTPGEQSHTAQFPCFATVHYPWHPLVGQTLTVKRQHRLPGGSRSFACLLPDGTWTLLPEWMTSRERCARLELVREPQVAAAALAELVAIFHALSAPVSIAKIAETTPH